MSVAKWQVLSCLVLDSFGEMGDAADAGDAADVGGVGCAGSEGTCGNTSFSNRVSELILSSCMETDTGARISSILRDSSGRTVVRVRTGVENNAVQLLKRLKGLWPLAKTSVVENKLDGTIEAQIVVPRESDELHYARQRASNSRGAEILYVTVLVLSIVGVILYAKDVYIETLSNERHFWSSNTSDREL